MTLEEAIIHAKQVAEMKRIEATSYKNKLDSGYCVKCAEEHEQIASWLTELKTIKEQKQGEWIMHSDKVGLSVECPFCHKEMAGDDLNYCCKCGAKLGGDT